MASNNEQDPNSHSSLIHLLGNHKSLWWRNSPIWKQVRQYFPRSVTNRTASFRARTEKALQPFLIVLTRRLPRNRTKVYNRKGTRSAFITSPRLFIEVSVYRWLESERILFRARQPFTVPRALRLIPQVRYTRLYPKFDPPRRRINSVEN